MWTWMRRLWRRRRTDGFGELHEALVTAVDSLTRRFTERRIEHALIGGVAVSLHGVIRATRDLDILVDSARASDADAVMRELGFETLARNAVFGNDLVGPLRVDLLFTQGRHTQAMLQRAAAIQIRGGDTKLVRPEDLIGLKLQALANRPDRGAGRADIEGLLRRFHADMDMDLVREYFALFGKETELDALLASVDR
jgi:predicted nucleotidyltransferase